MEFVTLDSFLPYFLLGSILSQISSFNQLKRYSIPLVINSVYCVKILNTRISEKSEISQSILLSATIFLAIVATILISNNTDVFARSIQMQNVLQTFSLMTYPVYLLHDEVFMSINSAFLIPTLGVTSGLAIGTALLVLTSFLIVKFYEPFVLRLFKKFIFS